ncbi:hypothetical protein G4Z05_04725 [Bacillus thermocopriae]|uniref:Uncharacterized protein n=1 Tax=Neobacillus thermocopriae TaxID=1215031 RepID=A0A6B3TMM7_9BACI|nr:hypothetical protein [Neobacillus thermocopriae]NEX78195.1 hypothetical protein [Neobacillus thermocopriae]
MDQKQGKTSPVIADFAEILKKAYEKGMNEAEITVEKLIEELKADLKHLLVRDSQAVVESRL